MSGIDGTQSVDNYTSRSVKAVLSVNSFQIATLQGIRFAFDGKQLW